MFAAAFFQVIISIYIGNSIQLIHKKENRFVDN